MKTLSISNPCPVNWNEMTPAQSGRYCDQCQMTVVDFSDMTDAEIKNYFTCNDGKKTCGRFTTSQVKRDAEINTFLSTVRTRLYRTSIKRYLLSLLAIVALMSGCNRKPTSHYIMGEPAYIENPDTTRNSPRK